MAEIYREGGEYTQAQPRYIEALKILRYHFGETLDVAATLHGLGLVSYALGQYGDAEEYYSQSLDIVNVGFDVTASLGGNIDLLGDANVLESRLEENYSIVANSLSQIHIAKGDYDQAINLLNESLSRIKTTFGNDYIGIASLSNSLGHVYLLQKDFDSAKANFEAALAALGADNLYTPVLLNNIGETYRAQGQYSNAETFYNRSITAFEKLYSRKHHSIARVSNNLGLSSYLQKDYENAAKHFRLSVQNEQANLNQNLLAGSERQKREYISTIAGTTSAVISLNQQALSADAKATQFAFDTILQRKGRVLDVWASSLQTVCQELDPEILALCNKYQLTISQRSNLEYLTKESSSVNSNYQTQLTDLNEEIQQLENQISRISDEFASTDNPVTSEDIRASLPSDSVLVEIVRYHPLIVGDREATEGNSSVDIDDDIRAGETIYSTQPFQHFDSPHYVAYILNKSGVVQSVDLGSADVIDTAVNALKESLSANNQGQPSTPLFQVKEEARTLDALVMSPIRAYLENTTTIFIAPDETLNLIPFEALVDEAGNYLAENYQFRYLTSGRDLTRLKNVSEENVNPAVLVGNPNYGLPGTPIPQSDIRGIDFENRIFPSLPGTQSEVEAIASQLPRVELFTKTNATESIVKQQEQPNILHIATHGFFEPTDAVTNPLLQSGLILAGASAESQNELEQDGILSALEVTGINLKGTQLVVLSACDTGVGKLEAGEGIYGLRRALVLAGARSQVLSLWKVNDDVTKDWMKDYYERILAGTPRDVALSETQIAFLTESEYSHPYYWAAFIGSGDWRPLP